MSNKSYSGSGNWINCELVISMAVNKIHNIAENRFKAKQRVVTRVLNKMNEPKTSFFSRKVKVPDPLFTREQAQERITSVCDWEDRFYIDAVHYESADDWRRDQENTCYKLKNLAEQSIKEGRSTMFITAEDYNLIN